MDVVAVRILCFILGGMVGLTYSRRISDVFVTDTLLAVITAGVIAIILGYFSGWLMVLTLGIAFAFSGAFNLGWLAAGCVVRDWFWPPMANKNKER
jgi:uncharacterized membrane protein